MSEVPEQWRRWIAGHADVTGYREVSRADGQARVWRVSTAGGALYLKLYTHRAAAAREVTALTTWGAAVGQVPTVVAAEGSALLSTEVPGAPVSSLATTADTLWTAAGAWLRRLHTLAHADADPLPLDRALMRRLDTARRHTAPGLVSRALIDEAEAALAQWSEARVPTHRDFAAHNWHWGSHGLWVLDFGQARPDTALADFVKLPPVVDDACGRSSPAADAFWSAYGARPSRAALRAALTLHGLGTVAWSERHGDRRGHEEGLSLLRALETSSER